MLNPFIDENSDQKIGASAKPAGIILYGPQSGKIFLGRKIAEISQLWVQRSDEFLFENQFYQRKRE